MEEGCWGLNHNVESLAGCRLESWTRLCGASSLRMKGICWVAVAYLTVEGVTLLEISAIAVAFRTWLGSTRLGIFAVVGFLGMRLGSICIFDVCSFVSQMGWLFRIHVESRSRILASRVPIWLLKYL